MTDEVGHRRAVVLVLASAVAGLSLPAWTAHAHPCIDEARALLSQGDFESAGIALTRCESAEDLSREDLARFYETRALMHLALGDDEASGASLTRLASVAPDHGFGNDVPPAVRERFERIRRDVGRVRLEVGAAFSESGAEVSATVSDPADVVQHVRLFGRVGGGVWESAADEPLRLVVPEDGATVRYYGVAEGIGAAPVAAAGSRAEPQILPCESCDDEPLVTTTTTGTGTTGTRTEGSFPWLLVGGGAAAAVVATIVLVVVLGSDSTQPSRPMPEGS